MPELTVIDLLDTPLTLLDRCDQRDCNAAAQHRFFFSTEEAPTAHLLFCGHHSAQHTDAVLAYLAGK